MFFENTEQFIGQDSWKTVVRQLVNKLGRAHILWRQDGGDDDLFCQLNVRKQLHRVLVILHPSHDAPGDLLSTCHGHAARTIRI